MNNVTVKKLKEICEALEQQGLADMEIVVCSDSMMPYPIENIKIVGLTTGRFANDRADILVDEQPDLRKLLAIQHASSVSLRHFSEKVQDNQNCTTVA